MIELIPYLLVLVWPVPDQPGRVEIERVRQLFASAQDCERAALAQRQGPRGAPTGHQCFAMPGSEEYDRLFAQTDAAAAGERAQ
ncbi:hypothetical protein C7451_104122 [Blastomonas natatoria]|uniref:Uncharacterized protein n=1 Tax=Blastomonas natatoria TaxID=34015 RepID=A0A2V3V7H3_9SPHN|nr:hypothetical protein [Blastomonas natatoria]PXW77627.1 hypothetical protein C7451_104122 [Blastomonas natatoria]